MTESLFRVDNLKRYLHRVLGFEIIVLLLLAFLSPRLIPIITHNLVLNIIIVAILVLGLTYSLLLTWRLTQVSRWVNAQHPESGPFEHPPRLLAATANLLRHPPTPVTDRTLLDSLSSRLDEQRESLRYMMGLAIFLGLLGTFWGLLHTVGSVGQAINSVGSEGLPPAEAFDRMRAGLQGPMQGMGMAFSASLLGLSTSLILSFLNLQVGHAQNRFHEDFEEWLSLRTAGYGSQPAGEDALATRLEAALSRVDTIERALATQAARLTDAPQAQSLEPFARDFTRLAESVQQLQGKMMEEALARLETIEALIASSQHRPPDEILSEALQRAAQHIEENKGQTAREAIANG
ncbi:flagellar motor protein MotA [Altericroceibacterium spongiae]|uniref:Flagellar motor protein MotA n=1 Tax=Altericroceibacterium spongiae TaxID=2320269 RepID=A0A420EE89_9SPHN|nr:MotA/TolQ/ExbB proton channel family protein [Altericroceibacterium spongiae]RKF18966.1 flagellar motor protein MotA [Altericroceibacterium spongiae]